MKDSFDRLFFEKNPYIPVEGMNIAGAGGGFESGELKTPNADGKLE